MDYIQFLLLFCGTVTAIVITVCLVIRFWERVKMFLACIAAVVTMLAMLWLVPLL